MKKDKKPEPLYAWWKNKLSLYTKIRKVGFTKSPPFFEALDKKTVGELKDFLSK